VNSSKEEILALVSRHGQEHLLAFWDQLDPLHRERLASQIAAIDFDMIRKVYAERRDQSDIRQIADRAVSPPSFRLGDAANTIAPDAACAAAVEALRAGQLGVVIVAGGQGTRLGFDHPKGMFPIGPVSGKSLFQIHVEKMVAASQRYKTPIPLYLMTSDATHDETVAYFNEHARFGLPADDLRVFRQGTMPVVDEATGKILLAEPGSVATSPDGHGGMLAALQRSGALADIRRRGVRHLFYFQVDNPLVDICELEFVGYHLLSGSALSSQVVRKQHPLERVGNVVEVDGRLRVIEYSDLPDEVAQRREADGALSIWAGSIAVHVMAVDFLDRMLASADGLPFHLARKKTPFVNEAGRRVEPKEPNAIKFERFIFDLMPAAERAIVVEVDAQDHFAPLKNAPGAKADTPDAVQSQMSALHRKWLVEAGVSVAENTAVEISPLAALDAGEAAARFRGHPPIVEATYLHE
jgi:UDP-N-acetylglucosamine/UDP-N-acetylgalactosamine diphosphorylase